MRATTNKKYTIDSLWINNVKGIEFACCHEDQHDIVVIVDGKIIVDGYGTHEKDGRVIKHMANVWNNIDKRYEYFNGGLKENTQPRKNIKNTFGIEASCAE